MSAGAGFFFDAARWARGRWWQWRLPLLAYLAWDGVRHLQRPEEGGLFAGITFGVHEFGHLIFAWFGEFMTVLGGSLNQLLIPVATGLLLYRSRDYFGIAVAGTWLSSSLMDLARYMGDARTLDLDLVGFGENAVHDWAWILGRLDALPYDTRIANLTRACAVVMLILSIGFGLWLSLQMGQRETEPG